VAMLELPPWLLGMSVDISEEGEDIRESSVDSGIDLYLTLPLVFPQESGGLPDSHCSPGKVQHSGCSPGGLW